MIGTTRTLMILGIATMMFASVVAAKEVPDDFKLVAKYSAGFSVWKQWETTITADGKAIQKITPGRKGGENSKKEEKLSKDDLKTLADTIKDADFSALKDSYRSLATDQPTLILEITRGKKTHKVEVYGPTLLTGRGSRRS